MTNIFLVLQMNCIIVLEKKFEDLIKYHTKENGNKKIISITVEKGKREIQAIDVLFLNMKKLFSMISLIQ